MVNELQQQLGIAISFDLSSCQCIKTLGKEIERWAVGVRMELVAVEGELD